jgi:hypothetical protein
MNANFDMAIFHVNTRPDFFCISGILITIALMCLSVIFLAHGAKLSGVAHSSAAFPSISDGNAPLMMHDEARGEAAMALSSSPIKVVREFGIYITANRTSFRTTAIVTGTERPYRQPSLNQPSIKS